MRPSGASSRTPCPGSPVRDVGPDVWAKLCAAAEAGEAVAVRDGGFTEVAPGTLTAIVV